MSSRQDQPKGKENPETGKEETDFHDSFLDGNEMIEEAIGRYYGKGSRENLVAVLDAIRQRMHADGHLIFPIIRSEKNREEFALRPVRNGDGKTWYAAFTSEAEYRKGEKSEILGHFIDSMMKNCLKTKADGFVINPWSKRPFLLARELMEMIFKADGDVEYTVPDEPVTRALLEDGSFLKKALEICQRNGTTLNCIKLMKILRDSLVWIPCDAILSDEDYRAWSATVLDAAEKGDPDSLTGQVFTSQESIRLIPDILKKDDDYYFPVFSSAEEMGEYGERFSKVQKHFPEAAGMARNNEKNVKGIVINPFSEAYVIPTDMFDFIARIPSSAEEEEDT